MKFKYKLRHWSEEATTNINIGDECDKYKVIDIVKVISYNTGKIIDKKLVCVVDRNLRKHFNTEKVEEAVIIDVSEFMSRDKEVDNKHYPSYW